MQRLLSGETDEVWVTIAESVGVLLVWTTKVVIEVVFNTVQAYEVKTSLCYRIQL